MPNILIVNGHQPFPTSPGRLNASLAGDALNFFEAQDCPVQHVETAKQWSVDDEVEKQRWADLILLQFPLNSMSVPWSLKRYLDEVYTAGMDGRLANGDGRSRSDPARQYGSGGLMHGRFYMLSVTCNAPHAAFSNPDQTLFAGRSLDDLLSPVHINFAFFGLTPLRTFAAWDVSKAPQIDHDFRRYDDHLADVMASLRAPR